jgi:myo-inositol-1(or 4)-monophosphatase
MRVPTTAWCLIRRRKLRQFSKNSPPRLVALPAVADPEELLDIAERLAVEASDLLVAGVEQRPVVGGDGVSVKSSPTDHATEWDHASERLIRERLGEIRPGDAVLGEELGAATGTTDVSWIVDPLDGTTNFIYGLPPFAVSIAAVVDGQVVAGAVADALHGELYAAHLGGGARRNGQPISVSLCVDAAYALCATGFSYDPDRRRKQAKVLVSVLPRIRDIRRAGAASVDLCWVACGRVDVCWERGLAAWDYSAGALIAAEAGAVVTDLAGGPPSEQFVLAATPGVADAVRALLADAGAGQA